VAYPKKIKLRNRFLFLFPRFKTMYLKNTPLHTKETTPEINQGYREISGLKGPVRFVVNVNRGKKIKNTNRGNSLYNPKKRRFRKMNENTNLKRRIESKPN
jgi:hypothetical protein